MLEVKVRVEGDTASKYIRFERKYWVVSIYDWPIYILCYENIGNSIHLRTPCRNYLVYLSSTLSIFKPCSEAFNLIQNVQLYRRYGLLKRKPILTVNSLICQVHHNGQQWAIDWRGRHLFGVWPPHRVKNTLEIVIIDGNTYLYYTYIYNWKALVILSNTLPSFYVSIDFVGVLEQHLHCSRYSIQ